MIIRALLVHAQDIALSSKRPTGQRITLQTDRQWSMKIPPTSINKEPFELRGKPALWYGKGIVI